MHATTSPNHVKMQFQYVESQCHNVSQWTKMIAGHPYCFRCFPPAFVPAFAIRRRRALCSFPFSIFPKAWGTNDLHIAPKLNSIRSIPECFMDFCAFTSTFWFVSLQDTVSYPRYCTLLTYPPAHLILSASWCFIPFPGPVHNCPTNWDPNSNPLTNHHLECKDILQGQLSESETPDFHHFLHKPQHPAATIVESSTFRALPCQLPLLPLLLWPIHSQPQPQARPSQTCSANVSKRATFHFHFMADKGSIPCCRCTGIQKKTESICDSRYILHHPSWFACSIHGPSMVHPWSMLLSVRPSSSQPLPQEPFSWQRELHFLLALPIWMFKGFRQDESCVRPQVLKHLIAKFPQRNVACIRVY